MKKLLSLALGTTLALAMAVPALAFTGMDQSQESKHPWKVKVQLVDYNTASFSNGYYTSLPSADRGYLRNEMVGAVISLFVPQDAKDGQAQLQLKSESVRIWEVIAENPQKDGAVADVAVLKTGGKADINATSRDDATYRYLMLGQLTGDKGSITAKVVDTTDNKRIPEAGVTVAGYLVKRTGNVYTITKDDNAIAITVDNNNYCKTMTITPKDKPLGTVCVLNGAIAFEVEGRIVSESSAEHKVYSDIYQEMKKTLGLDYTLKGYLYDSYFYGVKGTISVSDTAYLEPYMSDITVPTPPQVTPPKTGDASTLAGFVMVASALCGAVFVKKAQKSKN